MVASTRVAIQHKVHGLTPAKAHAWGICGGFFQARYIGGEPYKETYAGQLGTAVHELIAMYDRVGGRDASDSSEFLARNWRPGRFAAEDDERAREEGALLLSRYATMRAEETVEVLGSELFCQTGPRAIGDGQAIALSGRMDRIARRSDGTIEVLDLKTGGFLPTQDELRHDPATTIYHLLAAERHREKQVVVAQFSLRTGAGVEVALDCSAVAAGKERLREMARQLASGTFSLTPSACCAYCPARPTCPALQCGEAATDLRF